jgi:predicted aldo/keto reductase-like oxidoreductase
MVSRRKFIKTSVIAGAAVSIGSADILADTSDSANNLSAKTEMKYRRFGRTNLMLSEVGMGCASGLRSQQLGPVLFNRWREQIPTIVDTLLDRGGNVVATGSGYHDTEELLGRALKGKREKAYIFTSAEPKEDAKSVIASCERSLMRFQTDYLDGYFCHNGWSEGFQESSKKLQEQGKIRFIGQSCHVPGKHVEKIEANLVDFIFQPYNYMSLAKWTEKIDTPGIEDLFVLANKKDIGVLVMKPMSGHYIPNWAGQTTDPMVQKFLEELKKFGTKNLYQAFLLWVLKNNAVTSAVVGMNEAQDVIDDCDAINGRFSELHQELLERYTALATKDYCRLCETCISSCPRGIPIPDIQRFRMYYKNYGHTLDAREYYAGINPVRRASACDNCGACETACPNKVSIMKNLEDAHKLLA